MPDAERQRPPLSVVIPAREGMAEVDSPLEALLPEAEANGVEVVVVGGVEGEEPASNAVRLIPMPGADIYAMRRRGMAEAAGEVVAIGEDHAIPRPGWCEAVIRAHEENPGAAAVVGCLVNATDSTLAGRANFLAFAAAWQPPMTELPPRRPPPSSAVTIKRDALRGIEAESLGWVEAELIPSLFAQGLMVADGRITVDHYQDNGSLWSIRNAYDSARSSYGYRYRALASWRQRAIARWTLRGIPRRLLEEAREASAGGPVRRSESALIMLIALAAGLGGAVGALLGPGGSPDRVA